MLGAHHYQQPQPQPQPQQQFVFGHGVVPNSEQQHPQHPQQQARTNQHASDTPRPQSLVIPPAVAQNKAFVPPRPPSLIMMKPSSGAASSTAGATAVDSTGAQQSPRRSLLGAIGLGKGRRNTDLARHRKGGKDEKSGDKDNDAAHRSGGDNDGGGGGGQGGPPTAVTTEPESQNKVENKRAHMLRNPMLGGGRNVLQEMLKGACSNPVAFVLSHSH
jgi:hypothetical protein